VVPFLKRVAHLAQGISISKNAQVAERVSIWGGTTVRENCKIGYGTNIGRNVYLGPGVVVGQNCKIQNNSLIYEPAKIADGVFIGPGVILTNDRFPRALNLLGEPKSSDDWVAEAAVIKQGASLGAGVICIGGIEIGEWAMVAAGSVVTKDVKPHALVAGVPAAQVGWVSRAGAKLVKTDNGYVCPISHEAYALVGGKLVFY
jgi:UDP-2-acetamido-3-amino-2,3-dideoxy-glucuronate N-acetyltransferase